jgi:peptidyl-prolyl cis-trans isomerase SurA
MPIVRQEFAKEAKIDKVLAAKGDNPLIDARVFGGPEISPSNATYTDYFIYDFKLLTQPEEVGDVKGQVTGDYQNLLEQEWVQELREKYPITVNEKELSKLRKASKK